MNSVQILRFVALLCLSRLYGTELTACQIWFRILNIQGTLHDTTFNGSTRNLRCLLVPLNLISQFEPSQAMRDCILTVFIALLGFHHSTELL